MKLSGVILAGLMIVSVPGVAMAEGNSVADGKKSLSFSIPSGGNGYADGAAGVWMMAAPNINLGLNIGLAFANKPESSFDVLLAPAIRFYGSTEGDVLPFTYGQLNARIYSDGNDATDDDPEVGVAGGIGVEWFATKVFSVSGHVGVGLDLLRKGGSDAGVKLGTLTSGLTAQMYY